MSSSNDVFKALSDPTRREIIRMLRSGPLTSGEIAKRFDCTWPTISRHLSVLKEAGLITAERDGNSIRHELNSTVLQDLVSQIMDWTKKRGRNA